MSKVPYTKPALTYAEQIQQLKDRGLKIQNEPKATHLLEVISYYRLSGYWYPLLYDKANHHFNPMPALKQHSISINLIENCAY